MKTPLTTLLLFVCLMTKGQNIDNKANGWPVPEQYKYDSMFTAYIRNDTIFLPNGIKAEYNIAKSIPDIVIDTAAFNKQLYDTLRYYRGMVNAANEYIAHLERVIAINEKYERKLNELIDRYIKKRNKILFK